MPEMKIIRAMFDIKPIDQFGGIDMEKINQVVPTINLRKNIIEQKFFPPASREDSKANLLREFQFELKKKTYNLQTVLAKIGGTVHPSRGGEQKRRPMTIRQAKKLKTGITLPRPESVSIDSNLRERILDRAYGLQQKPILAAVRPVSREMEIWLEKIKHLGAAIKSSPNVSGERILKTYRKKVAMGAILLTVLLVLAGFLNKDYFQEKIVRDGKTAVANLESAKADIEKLDFASAAKNFTSAHYNFSNASDRLNLLSNAFTSFLGALPGFGKLKSAKNLVEAGVNIAQAGESLSLAVDYLSKTNFVSYLAMSGNQEKSLSDFITFFQDSLVFAQKKFKTASILLAEVDAQIIPEEKRPSFLDFQAQLPAFEEFLEGSLDYTDFLLELVGQSGPKKYLVLFQNNTELRPNGGFIGSYALADFNRGFLRSFEVKDVYEIDGQARTNLIPPKELQHITPVWGMRDANWFVNFPDSAKKIMQLYTENNGGPVVDGVITITPTVIAKILAITGPVELPEYQKIINSENFLTAIQAEVEYGPNRTKPKQILVDFAPKFLEKLGQLGKEKWAGVFKILTESMEQKHMLAYFKNLQMEKVTVEGGFGGEIKSAAKDYLSIIHTNIKGSKTDALIDNLYQLKSEVSETGTLEHDLSITRSHQGGKTDYGFYNRTNYDYLRVLVPEGSKLLEINGYSAPNFPLIIDYTDGSSSTGDFITDADLMAYEKKIIWLKSGVQQFSEGGKTVFGFWLILEPNKTKTVTLKYQTPISINDNHYSLLVQKQPGTLGDFFGFSLVLPQGRQVIYRSPDLTLSGDSINWQTKLLKDATLEVKLQ